MAVFLYVLTCLIFVNTNEAARILGVFPTPSISHQVVFRPLIQELVRRGHNITVITTDPMYTKEKTPPNLEEINVHDISYNLWNKKLLSRKNNNDDILSQHRIFLDLFTSLVDVQLQDEKVKKIIDDQEQQFDLLIIEAVARPALGYSHRFKAPVILISSLGGMAYNLETIGTPIHPMLYPGVPRQRINNITVWEKINELYVHYMNIYLIWNNRPVEHEMLKKHFGPDTPSIMELNKNADLLFLNMNPIFEGIRPVPPNVIYMGGLHQNPRKELPADIKSYLDSSKNGVIYISFGTNVDTNSLPADKVQILVKTVSQLPYDVLWKWNADELPGRTENIRIAKWFPQSDLLRHPKIKAFVTQGGLQSTDEAITAGVPLVVFPLLSDQFFNAERHVTHGIGIRVDLATVTEDQFKSALLKIITDDSYRENIARLRTLMHDTVQTPLERAVWWTEYVLRNGGAKHLRSASAHVTWAEYLELELVFGLLASLLAVIIVFIVCLRKLYYYVRNKIFGVGKLKRN
ncbi:unnamed protein product [Chrysodeixis includens]|uniref:UDP-glucuronosyltransferase n=1 Tax=Chrysodeixis includens TaxID=689277 RepID=A0A9N8Q1Q5_CHRIL|nr:unnamed protein product [Chrysodeixis includens]